MGWTLVHRDGSPCSRGNWGTDAHSRRTPPGEEGRVGVPQEPRDTAHCQPTLGSRGRGPNSFSQKEPTAGPLISDVWPPGGEATDLVVEAVQSARTLPRTNTNIGGKPEDFLLTTADPFACLWRRCNAEDLSPWSPPQSWSQCHGHGQGAPGTIRETHMRLALLPATTQWGATGCSSRHLLPQ